MNKLNHNYLIPLYVSVALALGVLLGDSISRGFEKDKLQQQRQLVRDINNNKINSSKLYEVLSILDESYVDRIDKDSLFNSTINDLLHKLDPHTNYIPSKDVLRMRESIEGKFGGIGVRFFILRDTICVTNVIQNTPADNAGVKSGDRIIKIDSKPVAGVSITNEEVMAKLKGLEGSVVKFTVLRNKKSIDFQFDRGEIPLKSINCAYMLDEKTGYIQISQFSIPTYDEFIEASKDLLDNNMSSMILDLRNNGWGVMESAVRIVDEFLPENQLIVSANGKNFKPQNYFSSSSGILKNIPIVILINEYSASASEIVAGAIQDNDRGLVIGKQSFGKGLIQEDKKMSDGGKLRVTVARYYTPSGRCIQRPYEGKSYEDYINNHDRFLGSLNDSIKDSFPDSLKFKTVFKKRLVYGAGGIYPDIFIDYDSVPYSSFFINARLIGGFTAFAFDFLENRRSLWKTFNQFYGSTEIESFRVESFYRYCQEEYGLSFLEKDSPLNQKYIKNWIFAEIARQLWLDVGYYKIVNKEDHTINKALNFLSEGLQKYDILVY